MNSASFQIFNASAGSGKTFTLVKEYLKILIASESFFKFKEVLAITFTNKAVGEMKHRIIEKLKLFSADNPESIQDDTFSALVKELQIDPETINLRSKHILNHIINNYAAFNISTIDRFIHKIIRTFAYDLKLPQNFEVELDTEILLNQAVDNLIAKAGNDKELTKVLVDFALEKTDEDKSWDISIDLYNIAKILVNENHITHLESLKTKSLKDFKALKSNILAKSIVIEQEIINKAKSILELIKRNGLHFDDFSGKNGYLPSYFKKLIQSDFSVDYSKVWMSKIETHPLYPITKTTPEIKSVIDKIQPQIANAFFRTKQNVTQLALLKNIYKNVTPLSVLNAINNELNLIKEEKNVLLISEFNKIISEEIKNQPIPFIYERIGEKFKHYFIDEFQDTSELQWKNLQPLVDNVLSGADGTTLLVGDAKQAIYRWRGGKAEQFINLFNKTNIPFAIEQEVKNLPVNYRSSKDVVEFNNAFFSHLAKFAFKKPEYASLYSISPQECFNEDRGIVDIKLLEISKNDDSDEVYTKEVILTINQILQNDYQLGDICILVRKRKEGEAIADALANEGISIISSETLLLNRSSHVNFLINMMRLSIQPDNNEIKVKILDYMANARNIKDKHNFFSKHISESPVELFRKLQGFEFDAFLNLSIYDSMEFLIREFELFKSPDAYVQFFLDEVLNFSQKNKADFTGFLTYWESKNNKLSIISPEGQNAVQIMTIHKAKGLEFPVVIFPYAELNIYEERFPKTWFNINKTEFEGFDKVYINLNRNLELVNKKGSEIYLQHQGELELDNINLLYVALTRPTEQLYIIGKKDVNSKGVENMKSYSGLLINFLKTLGFWHDSQNHYIFGRSGQIFKKDKQSIQIVSQKEIISTDANSHNITIITKSGYLWDTAQKEAIEKGILIHNVMSQIKTKSDIQFVLQDYLASGIIDNNQITELSRTINSIVLHPKLKNYYRQDLKIYNEVDIVSKNKRFLRPDRIVINTNNEAVIIDYKTGSYNVNHVKQLQEYEDVLKEMKIDTKNRILVYINDIIDIKEV